MIGPLLGNTRLSRALLAAVLLGSGARSAHAIVANPNPIEITQPDGTRLTVHVVGDERMHWWEDRDGYVIVQEQGEYRYATRGADGDLVATSHRAGSIAPASLGISARIRPAPELLARRMAMQRVPRQEVTITPPTGTVKNLVVLAQFSDHGVGMTRTASDFDKLFNTIGGDLVVAPTGSVRDVWKENSYNRLDLVSTIQNWVLLPNAETWYANGNSGFTSARRDSMVKDALALLDATVNFATFDGDNDGYVDAIDVIHSGYGSEASGNTNQVWSQQWVLATDWASTDRNANNVLVKVSRVHTEPALFGANGTAICRIGVIAHETGHFFGLPDLYDTDYQGMGAGLWCLMGDAWGWDTTQRRPPQLSAWCKMKLGYITPFYATYPGQVTLPQVETNPSACIISPGYGLFEYLLIENRQPVGMDRLIPQGGLAIWHIDMTIPHQPGDPCNATEGYPGQAGWPGNGKHYAVALLQADGRYDLEKLGWINNVHGDTTDLYHGPMNGFVLSEATVPSSDRYESGYAQPTANEISEVSASGATMTFRFRPAVWVEFSYGGGGHLGTFHDPYTTLPDALNAIDDDGIVICKPGTTASVPPSSRVMRYKSYGGTTTFSP